MSEFETTRRGLLRLGASLVALLGLPREGRTQALDQGIGGTGVAAPGPEDRDQGIGGTGVIGTIKKFGSIYVNDLRITYPQDAVVRIDGQPSQIEDLKIGQVVHVVAASRDGGYATRMIDVQSEVVGPVQRTADGSLVVLGQTVATDELPQSFAGKVGETVAVSGLRRPDGTIVASLVEPRPGAAPLVAGPVTRAPDGRLQIGGLPLAGLDPASVGQRVSTQVVARGGAYAAIRPQSAQRPFGPRVTHLSIEAYVERNGPGLRLGSGFAVGGGRDLDLPAEGTTRAVLNTSVGPDGRAFVTSARAVPHGPGFGGRGPGGRGPGGGGGRGPGGGGPGRFGPGGRGPGGFGPGGRGPGGGPGGRMGPGFGPGPRFGGPFGPGGGRRGFGGGPGGGGRGFRGGGGRGFRGGGGRGGGGGRRR